MVEDGSDSAATLIGMPGFVVRAAAEDDDGQVWVLVETTAKTARCAGCGVRAESKGRKEVKVRDLPVGGRPVVLVWRKRRWRCRNRVCPRKTWTEKSELIAPRAVLTGRAREEIFRQVGGHVRATAEVAREFGVCWDTAWKAFVEQATPLVEDPARIDGVEALGVDETGFLKATATHPKQWATGLVDVRRGLLVDVILGRDAQILRNWLGQRQPSWLAAVEVVTIDPFEAYRNGLFPHLGHARLVADPFHIVRLGNRAVDDVRRRTQQEQTGHRGRRGDPLYDIRKVLLTGNERLNDRARRRLDTALGHGDPKDEVLAAWLAKEHLREIYAVTHPDDAAELLESVIVECATSEVPELRRLAGTLRKWRTEIINRHRTGDSNGPTEAMNLLIKQIKRVGRGFTNFGHYRLRLLAHCSLEWQTHPTASMRRRSPHFAA